MRNEEFYKLPRLYVDAPLKDGDSLPLSADHAHYLRNVIARVRAINCACLTVAMVKLWPP